MTNYLVELFELGYQLALEAFGIYKNRKIAQQFKREGREYFFDATTFELVPAKKPGEPLNLADRCSEEGDTGAVVDPDAPRS